MQDRCLIPDGGAAELEDATELAEDQHLLLPGAALADELFGRLILADRSSAPELSAIRAPLRFRPASAPFAGQDLVLAYVDEYIRRNDSW